MATYDANSDDLIALEEVRTHPVLGIRFGAWDPDKDGRTTRSEYRTIRDALSSNHYGLVAFAPDGVGRVTGPSLRWRHQRSLSGVTTPLIYNDVVYIIRDGGILTTLDPETGEVFKTGRVEGAPGTYFASPVAVDGKVLLVNEDCDVSVIRAAAQWELLRVNSLGSSDSDETCYATPAIDEDGLYVRTSKFVYASGLSRSPD